MAVIAMRSHPGVTRSLADLEKANGASQPCARRTVNRYFYDAGSELTGVQMLESFGTDAPCR
jgi:hypothetical protein